jgi:hypothetical protein
MDLYLIKNIAVGAAYRGAKIIQSHFGRISHIDKKGTKDKVCVKIQSLLLFFIISAALVTLTQWTRFAKTDVR